MRAIPGDLASLVSAKAMQADGEGKGRSVELFRQATSGS